MKLVQYIFFLTVVISLSISCREVYYPEDLDSGKSIPVIHAQVQENNPPTAELSYAMIYQHYEPDYISGADVTVSDDAGNSAKLFETDEPGHYEANPGDMIGVSGRTYLLHVKLPDGQVFESSYEKLPAKPHIDSLYAVPGERTVYKYNQYFQPVTTVQQGLFISSAMSAAGDSTIYYRFNTHVFKESTYIRNPGTPVSTPVFVWASSTLDNVYAVDYTMQVGDMQVRPGHSVGYLQYLYDPLQATSRATAPITLGWVLTYNVYAISKDVYDYYKSIADQLGSDDQIFAPTPSQVKGNIRCITDPNAPLIGVFEVNSLTVQYKAFRYIDLNTYVWKDLDFFPSGIADGEKLYSAPSFWVTFN